MLAAVTTTANFKVTFHWHRAKLHQRGGELWTANFYTAFHLYNKSGASTDHQWTCYSSFSTALGFKFKIQQPHPGSVLFDYLFIFLFYFFVWTLP